MSNFTVDTSNVTGNTSSTAEGQDKVHATNLTYCPSCYKYGVLKGQECVIDRESFIPDNHMVCAATVGAARLVNPWEKSVPIVV